MPATVKFLPAVLVAVALAALSACGGGTPSTASDVVATQRPPSKGPEGPPGTKEQLNTVGGLLVGEPVYNADFADPFVLSLGDALYSYATNTDKANIPVMRAVRNASDADYLGDALPDLPSWTSKGNVWAPVVYAPEGGGYVMYYATRDTSSGRQCISLATSDSPAGPFTDNSSSAFVCPLDLGGAIDPAVVVDNGNPHLIYKSDGNCCGQPTSIWSVPLASDGLSTTGDPVKLISNDRDWEGGVVEGPSMVKVKDKYYLFYSGNNWASEDYAVGYAVCDSVTGPCTKPGDEPWMRSTSFAKGPGGQEFFEADGQVWMVYHGWLPGQVATPGGERRLYLDVVTVDNGTPERIGAARTFAQLLQLALVAVVIVVLAVLAIRALRRRRREPSPPTPAGSPGSTD